MTTKDSHDEAQEHQEMHKLGCQEHNLGCLVSLSKELTIPDESNNVTHVVKDQKEEYNSKCYLDVSTSVMLMA